jgi:hypothetical protein
MVKIKGVKFKKKKTFNYDAMAISNKKFIREHPYYSAMYHDEIMAERLADEGIWKKGVWIHK